MNRNIKIYFAPFQGITNQTFRHIYAQFFEGIDAFYTPYFTGIKNKDALSPRYLAELKNQTENKSEVIPQILSKDADEIIYFAQQCKQLGFRELNWNLGCPHPQVANKKRGSGLLPFPDMIQAILKDIMAQIDLKFSIKCRLGYEDNEELKALIPVFNSFAISELIIHARTGKQMYSGEADWEAFAQIAPQLTMPVVYNGDITSSEKFAAFSKRFVNFNRLMLGRGILADPFLPARIKGLELPIDKKAHLHRFMDNLYYAYRKAYMDRLTLLGVLKEYWSYLAFAFNEPHKIMRKLKKCKSFDAYEDAVFSIFNDDDLAI
ncbi:MAG: tRNA-dihydrouridine synthase family protein [Bacteroidales bacterium]|nr:tRNA-dihydrouridine synthase family protein [Bacteroidales bacterium]